MYHGAAQGTIGWVRNKNFWGSALAGAAGHASGVAMQSAGLLGGAEFGDVAARTAVSATFGGLASEATGGDFAQGAMVAAIVHLYNSESHNAQKTPAERAKAKLTNKPLSGSKLSKANPAVGQGCGAYQCRTGGKHAGVDILATDGTKLQAPGSGTASVGYLKGYGKTVLINHGDGVQTRFAHLASYTVKEGAKVTVTTDIGTVGRTGNVPSGGQSHLHFEVLVDGSRINPSDVFTWAQDK
jgi:murein DD-endopeptidase MepM/ murein hydrolase activator NlpD